MRLSQYPHKTFREDPSRVETTSQRLMYRAGLLAQVANGLFIYPPFMWRTIRKIEQITREEMDRAGAVELMMPILQPREPWEQTGRWDDYVRSGTMFHLRDRKNNELCLGPTHEEVITSYAAGIISSYADLPVTLYQIAPKCRDELRPRGGLIRGREFVMKDAYSFDPDEEGLDRSYEAQRQAYERVFTRCGLEFLRIEADPGAIGGTSSHEFMVVSDAGEDTVITCDSCGYAANIELAQSRVNTPADAQAEAKPSHIEATPDARTVDDLVQLFPDLSAPRMVKTILYEVAYKSGRKEVVAVLMRGDLDINEVKLSKSLGEEVAELVIAFPDTVQRVTGAEVGFAGPIGLKDARIVADHSVRPLKNFLCGANKTGHHVLDVNWGRDFPEPKWLDLRNARQGDGCPRCEQGRVKVTRGIEIGHLFRLGTKYSHAPDKDNPHGLSATYLGRDGKSYDVVMGCYGIGITRIAAAAVELYHDDNGIIWPMSIAPYHVVIVTANVDRKKELLIAERLYQELTKAGVEVVLDDREGRIGPKLKDADLIGFPYKLIVGKGIQEGRVDLKDRRDGIMTSLGTEEAVERVSKLVGERLRQYE